MEGLALNGFIVLEEKTGCFFGTIPSETDRMSVENESKSQCFY